MQSRPIITLITLKHNNDASHYGTATKVCGIHRGIYDTLNMNMTISIDAGNPTFQGPIAILFEITLYSLFLKLL
jgi:hypothetical protein